MRTRTSAFTLIELMVVVAIIGLLAAIAIPNYVKFQCRSKQGEAKAGLGSWFIAERTFFTEHDTYGTDLISIHWQPDGAPRYLWGFQAAQFPSVVPGLGTAYDPSRNNTGLSAVYGSPARYSTLNMVDVLGSPLDAANLPPITSADSDSFTLGGIADLTGGSGYDEWIMTDKRELTAINNDCTSL